MTKDKQRPWRAPATPPVAPAHNEQRFSNSHSVKLSAMSRPGAKKQAPTLHAVSMFELIGTVSFPKAFLAILQQMQPTLQVLSLSAAQFAGFQTAPPQIL